jgi:hypothetical protein
MAREIGKANDRPQILPTRVGTNVTNVRVFWEGSGESVTPDLIRGPAPDARGSGHNPGFLLSQE